MEAGIRSRQSSMGVPKMRNSMPRARKCAAIDNPKGPAPTITISVLRIAAARCPLNEPSCGWGFFAMFLLKIISSVSGSLSRFQNDRICVTHLAYPCLDILVTILARNTRCAIAADRGRSADHPDNVRKDVGGRKISKVDACLERKEDCSVEAMRIAIGRVKVAFIAKENLVRAEDTGPVVQHLAEFTDETIGEGEGRG